MALKTVELDALIASIREKIAAAEHRHGLLALRLDEEPGDQATNKALTSIESEMHELARELKRKQSSRAQAVARDSVEHREEELQALKAASAAAVKAARERAAVGAKIEALLSTYLKAHLSQYQELNNQCRAKAAAVGMACMGRDFTLHGHNLMAAAMGETGGAPSAFVEALLAAGVGAVGIQVPLLFNLHAGGNHLGIEAAALLDAEKLAFRLNELIEKKEKQSDALDEAVARRDPSHIATARELVAPPMEGPK